MENYYAVLGVKRCATDEQIRIAFRQLAREHHPDAQGGVELTAANQRMAQINIAYKTLIDPKKRREHDDYLDRQGVGTVQERAYWEPQTRGTVNSAGERIARAQASHAERLSRIEKGYKEAEQATRLKYELKIAEIEGWVAQQLHPAPEPTRRQPQKADVKTDQRRVYDIEMRAGEARLKAQTVRDQALKRLSEQRQSKIAQSEQILAEESSRRAG